MARIKPILAVSFFALLLGAMQACAYPSGAIPITDCQELQDINNCLDCDY